jgi:hypothetical protein
VAEPEQVIMVSTLVSARDGSGRVQMEGPRVAAQLSIEEARDLGQNLLQAATHAEVDAFLLGWAIGKVSLGQREAAILLSEFRAYCQTRVAEPLAETEP